MSEFDKYIRQGEPQQAEKARIWNTAIGLQDVDGLKTSQYLKETAQKHIEGDISIDEVRSLIDSYYKSKEKREEVEERTEEADKVSAAITAILSEKTFTFSPDYLISIHRRIFSGVFKFAGQIRDYNISKAEWVLDGASVLYGDAYMIRQALDYDFSDGLGYDSWTAETNAKTPWAAGDYNYYRNNAALKWAGFDTQFFAALGEAMYIRMTITAVGEAGTSDPGVCCTCGKPKFPVFQIGAIYDRMCADKQRHVKYCNCHEIPCRNGCNQAQSQEGKTYAIVRVEYKDEFNDNIYPAGMVRVNDGETVTIEPVKLSGYTEPASVQVKFENGKLTDAQNEGVGTVKFKYIKE